VKVRNEDNKELSKLQVVKESAHHGGGHGEKKAHH
jgi:hypothetical protein